jgi:hypothetical protein
MREAPYLSMFQHLFCFRAFKSCRGCAKGERSPRVLDDGSAPTNNSYCTRLGKSSGGYCGSVMIFLRTTLRHISEEEQSTVLAPLE